MARYRQFRRSSMHMHFKIAGAGHGDLTWFSGAQRSRESATSAKFAISGLQSGECNCSPFCILSWPREKNCSPYPWIYKLYVLKEIYQVGVRTARHGEETRHQTACKITPRASDKLFTSPKAVMRCGAAGPLQPFIDIVRPIYLYCIYSWSNRDSVIKRPRYGQLPHSDYYLAYQLASICQPDIFDLSTFDVNFSSGPNFYLRLMASTPLD